MKSAEEMTMRSSNPAAVSGFNGNGNVDIDSLEYELPEDDCSAIVIDFHGPLF